MNGSTVVIGPPDGNMKQYIHSLEKLKNYDIEKIAPGHGELLDNPHEVAEWIISHRLEREKKVFHALKEATRELLILWSKEFMMMLIHHSSLSQKHRF
ncbi:MAG: hypothetical protein CM15mP86_18920 [Gammaproteobacteria bacterium]|nr:MAG: hypothetical protein CM15mP86_18920 [Gammaproteobacteria bacterium]